MLSESSMPESVHFAHVLIKAKRTYSPVHNAHMRDSERSDQARRLEQARLARGFERARHATEFFGWNYSSYSQHERGERGLTRATAEKYGLAYRVSAAWLLTGEGRGPAAGRDPRHIPIMGYVGAGAAIEPEFEQVPPEGLDQVEIPFAVPDDLIGLEVRGDSMLPRYEAGDVVVVWRDQRGTVEALLGEEAAVRTADGRRYLKRLVRGPSRGTFNLESTNASARTIEGARIVWASEVYLTVRAAQIRRIAERERAARRRRPDRGASAKP